MVEQVLIYSFLSNLRRSDGTDKSAQLKCQPSALLDKLYCCENLAALMAADRELIVAYHSLARTTLPQFSQHQTYSSSEGDIVLLSGDSVGVPVPRVQIIIGKASGRRRLKHAHARDDFGEATWPVGQAWRRAICPPIARYTLGHLQTDFAVVAGNNRQKSRRTHCRTE